MPAGAPKKNPLLVKKPFGIKLSQWVIDWLRKQEPGTMNSIIEDAVIEQHKLKPPKIK